MNTLEDCSKGFRELKIQLYPSQAKMYFFIYTHKHIYICAYYI